MDNNINQYNDENSKELGNKISIILSSNSVKEILKEIGKESSNIGRMSEMIGDIYTYMFVHRDSNGLEEFITKINAAYKEYRGNPKKMTYIRGKLLSNSICEKLGIKENDISLESQEKIKSYFLKNYVEHGFVTHSFNGSSEQSIRENGFSSNKRVWDNQEVLDIAKIFTDKGVIAPVGGYSHYSGKGLYVEHNQKNAFWHSAGGPEWFKWFTSSTHNENSTKIEDSPYYLKDYDACKKNVMDLCDNSKVSEQEKIKVESFFDKMWESLGTTDTYTALIPKSIIGKNNPKNAICPNKDAIETIISVLNDESKEYTEHGGNCFEGEIPVESVVITKMPNAKELFGNRTYSRETQEQLFDKEKTSNLVANIKSAEKVKEGKNNEVLLSAVKATEMSIREGEIQYQTKILNEVYRDRQMGEQSHEKTRSYGSNSNIQK